MKNPYTWLKVTSFSIIGAFGEILAFMLGKKEIYIAYIFSIKRGNNLVLNTYTHHEFVYRPFIHGLYPLVTIKLKASFGKTFVPIIETSNDLTLHIKRSITDKTGSVHEQNLASLDIKDARSIIFVDKFNWDDAFAISCKDFDISQRF